MLDSGLESITAASTASVVSGASAQLIVANSERNGLRVQVDPAGAGNVYLLLGAGVASATSFHVVLAPGGFWDGRVGPVSLWRGAVQMFGTGARVAVVEG